MKVKNHGVGVEFDNDDFNKAYNKDIKLFSTYLRDFCFGELPYKRRNILNKIIKKMPPERLVVLLRRHQLHLGAELGHNTKYDEEFKNIMIELGIIDKEIMTPTYVANNINAKAQRLFVKKAEKAENEIKELSERIAFVDLYDAMKSSIKLRQAMEQLIQQKDSNNKLAQKLLLMRKNGLDSELVEEILLALNNSSNYDLIGELFLYLLDILPGFNTPFIVRGLKSKKDSSTGGRNTHCKKACEAMMQQFLRNYEDQFIDSIYTNDIEKFLFNFNRLASNGYEYEYKYQNGDVAKTIKYKFTFFMEQDAVWTELLKKNSCGLSYEYVEIDGENPKSDHGKQRIKTLVTYISNTRTAMSENLK